MKQAQLPSHNGARPEPRFQPKEIVLLVEHQEQIDPGQLARLMKHVNDQAPGDVEIKQRRTLSFPRTGQRGAFSLIFTDISGIGDDPAAIVPLIKQLQRLLDRREDGLTLRSISPNWFGSRAPQLGGGGPGAKPVRGSALPKKWWNSPVDGRHTPFGFALSTLPPFGEARQAVEVAILDTAPCLHDLARAFHTWQIKHPLIRSLLRPDGPLEISYAAYDDLLRLSDFELKDHTYEMADHGLFVAGIIHSIAPQAKLRLIEVLNPNGIGDIETIALGLAQVLERQSTAPLVVNCSLVLNLPLSEELDDVLRVDPSLRWLNQDLLRRMRWPLEWICDVLQARDVLIVAAAGNDAVPGKPRPGARYPAAFKSVIGVGALVHGNVAASYSDLADSPEETGFMAFGGAANHGVSIPFESMLGIYIGRFPDGRRSTSGWAWWAGTSFAAPVISGALARLISQGRTPHDAEQALRDAETAMTPDGAEILTSPQG